MLDFIVNPRRSPRAPARCQAEVTRSRSHARFAARTEDVGSMGCQVIAPAQVVKDDALRVVITDAAVAEPLDVTGKVAWVSPLQPWRVGIAFSDKSLADGERWFGSLVSAYPELEGFRRVPDRIRKDAFVYLARPPRFIVDFTSDEALILRAIASGARADELMARLRHRWPAVLRALFSLLARNAVTLQRGQSVHPDSWKKILAEVEASLAVESLGDPGPSVSIGWREGEPVNPTRVVDLEDDGIRIDVETGRWSRSTPKS